jgi:large subunit ribosomal protein L30
MSDLKITQIRSQIRCLKRHKRTLEALGLRRMNHSVIHRDTPQIRGMVDQVHYLVRVEPVSGGADKGGKS